MGERRGRPRAHAEGNRINMTFRVRKALHEGLTASALKEGRSLSEEIEHRLERSFDREAIVRALAKVMLDG